ncbi:unnamed protein product, partial [Mesorhabditis spiculigera]
MSLKLETSDGEIFTVPKQVIGQSGLVSTLLADADVGEDGVIPLPNVAAPIMRKVLIWCSKHKDDPKKEETEEDNKPKEKGPVAIPAWDTEFFKVDNGVLFEIVLAANYLQIPRLVHLGCGIISNKLRGKTSEEIKREFTIV